MAKKSHKSAKTLTKATEKGLSKPIKPVQLGLAGIERLEYVLKLTLRTRPGLQISQEMLNQADRIRERIRNFKKS